MQVRIVEDRCQGHTLCAGVAPQLFKLRDEDGHAYVERPEVDPDLEALARRAALGCPERAIEIDD